MANVTIDGTTWEARNGERLIDVINRVGAELAQVCYHKQLGPIQTCDTCMAEIDGALGRACAATVKDGMKVVTKSARARAAQEEAYNLLLTRHVLYCTVCDNNNGNCTMHNTEKLLQIDHQTSPFQPKPYEEDHTNPFYRYDPQQCILCGRCVEACQNVQVNETLSINWEDPHPRVLWDGGKPMGESSCVSCGHCVNVCPCNALMEKSMLGQAGYMTGLAKQALNGMIDFVKGVEPDMGYRSILKISEIESHMRESRTKRTKTVCTYCGTGCSFEMWTRDRHILKVEPGEGPVNGISTCVKGKYGWDWVNSPDRLTKPLIRDGETIREATWNEALGLIARKFKEIKEKHGPDALAFIASSKGTNEESYLMQKLARSVIGTNNIDNCARYCQDPAATGLNRTVGIGGDAGSIKDIENAGLVLIVGSNTAESHPVIATRVKSSHKLRGQKLMVVDVREHELAQRADLFVRPNPGTDLIWLSAMSKYILDNGLEHKGFLQKWVNGLEEYRKSLEPFTLEFAAKECGISVETLKKMADMIVRADGVCILFAMGITQHSMGSDSSTAISNLLLVTGNYMRHGAGAYPLRGHNNVQGACDHGTMPNVLPGYQPVTSPEVQARFEKAWGTPLPKTKGLDNHEMVENIYAGKLKSLYLFGEEMSLVDANANYVSGGLEKLEFFVVQEVFFSHTCQYADVILPASPSLEKDGTFTNTERRIQRIYQVFEPLGDSRPDWRIIRDIANAMGAGWKYEHPSEIYDEIEALTPLFAGVNYTRLEGFNSLQWPVRADGIDEPLLYTEGFNFPDKKARLYPLALARPDKMPDEQYDVFVNNGNVLEHFHEGNLTGRVPGIREKMPNCFVEISPEYAKQRDIESGRWVRVISRDGAVKLQALVTDRVHGKQVFIPMNSIAGAVNYVTGSHTDPVTHTPAYKETAARIEVLPEMGESPLPRVNSRFGKPTPQNGVEVERKWKRADYRMPGSEHAKS